MSLFKTRRERRGQSTDAVADSPASVTEGASGASVEGVTLCTFVTFMAMVGEHASLESDHELIAQRLGFPPRRYNDIRNAWLARVYSSPALAREFGELLDEARATLA